MGGACTKGKSGVTEPVKVEQHAENETLLKQNTHKSENDRASMVSEEDIGTFEPAHAEAIANHKSDYVDHAASKRNVHGVREARFASLPQSPVEYAGKRLSLRCVGILPEFVADPKDESLQELLSEAFAVIEYRFAELDRDGAGQLTFRLLETQLALKGFDQQMTMQDAFKMLDVNNDGSMDFAEFLCMLYLWSHNNPFDLIFANIKNCQVVSLAFNEMEDAWVVYDANKNRHFSYSDLKKFMSTRLPLLWAASTAVLDQHFPQGARDQGQELTFSKFMHLLYCCFCHYEGSRVPGQYQEIHDAMPLAVEGDQGAGSPSWLFLTQAFEVLEEDFTRFDLSGDGTIDYSELTQGIPSSNGDDKLDIITRLEYKFKKVDKDDTQTVDFFEFCYLALMMTQDGSYRDLVGNTRGASLAYRALISITTRFRALDVNKIQKLVYSEVVQYFTAQFGAAPAELKGAFESVAVTSLALGEQLVVDIANFLRVLYYVTRPGGKYHPTVYSPVHRRVDAHSFLISIPDHRQIDFPPRIDPVEVKFFEARKPLGKGAQGIVHLGTYKDREVAGKTMLGKMTPQLQKELETEVRLMLLVHHPNCHFLIGAKTTPEDGGPLLLTEVCHEGSLFDVYAKKRKVFDQATAHRLSKECALGLECLHKLGYMHRDVKSLNVFMTADFVPRIADFGMATNDPLRCDPCGTVQWMAPEVMSNFVTSDKVQYDKRCDVYSYGILIWEIWHCRCPYAEHNCNQMQIAYLIWKDKIRPSMDSHMREDVQNLICSCWEEDPAKRPTFSQVIKTLDAMLPLVQTSKPS